MSGSSKGVTVKVLISFFSYFQVWQSYVDMAAQISYYLMELAVVKAQELKRTQSTKRLQYPYLDCSSICMPGIIVLVMNCQQRELYEAICFF